MEDNHKTSKKSGAEEKVTDFDMVEEFVPDNEAIIQNRNISCMFRRYFIILVAVADSFEAMDIKPPAFLRYKFICFDNPIDLLSDDAKKLTTLLEAKPQDLQTIYKYFHYVCGLGKNTFDLPHFLKVLTLKEQFFGEALFFLYDIDYNNNVDWSEFLLITCYIMFLSRTELVHLLFVLLDTNCNELIDAEEYCELRKEAGQYIDKFPKRFEDMIHRYAQPPKFQFTKSCFVIMCHEIKELVEGTFYFREKLLKNLFPEMISLQLTTREVDVYSVLSSYYRSMKHNRKKKEQSLYSISPDPSVRDKYMDARYKKLVIKRSVF